MGASEFSRYLELQMANQAPEGLQKEAFLKEVGQRLLATVEDVTKHGEVAAERVRLFLNSQGAHRLLQTRNPGAALCGARLTKRR